MENQTEGLTNSSHKGEPIFILGISQRSGTNFLFDLLLQHPDCWGSSVNINEDFLIHHSELLTHYCNIVVSRWKKWVEKNDMEDSVCKGLGDGLVSFLTAERGGKRYVTKTPSVRNLDRFFKFFPGAYLIILIRDGRAVVESRVKTFGESYGTAIRNWAEAADTILRNDQVLKDSQFKSLIVKYEDLCEDLEGEMRRILGHLDLDCKAYDFESAVNLPVRGSSAFSGKGMKEIHWQPVEKTQDFNPLERWRSWNRSRHEHFNHVAGKYLSAFGYEEKRFGTNRLLWACGVRLMLLQWKLERFIVRLVSGLKWMVKQICGEDNILKIRSVLSKSNDRTHPKAK